MKTIKFTLIIFIFLSYSCRQRPARSESLPLQFLSTAKPVDSTKVTISLPLDKDSSISFYSYGIPTDSLAKHDSILVRNKRLYIKIKLWLTALHKSDSVTTTFEDEKNGQLAAVGTEYVRFGVEKLPMSFKMNIRIKNSVDTLTINDLYFKKQNLNVSAVYKNYLKNNFSNAPLSFQKKIIYSKMFDDIRTRFGNLIEGSAQFEVLGFIPEQYQNR